jgi:peptide/nickel transport system substrate-binding protein
MASRASTGRLRKSVGALTPLPTLAVAAVLVIGVAVTGALAQPNAGSRANAASKNVVPKKGGTLIYRVSAAPDCIDPQRTAQSAAFQLFDPVMDTLVKVNPKGKYVGYLAESWNISTDGLTYTFVLRKGLRFSNGRPLTAYSVKRTFDRALDPATNSPVSGPQLKGVTKVVVDNKRTVRLLLSAPSRPLLANLAGSYLGILDPIALKDNGAASFCQYPIGSGPFYVKSVGPAFSDVVLARNPYHSIPWGNNPGPAYLDQIDFKLIPDEATAASAILSGEIDVDRYSTTQQSRLINQAGIKLRKQPDTGSKWLIFNTERPPFNDVNLRRAIAEVIDRATIVRIARQGIAVVTWSPLPTLMPFHTAEAKGFAAPYNPAVAKQYFAGKSFPDIDFMIGPPAADAPTAQLIQQWVAEAGGPKINITLRDNAGYNQAAQNGQMDMTLNGWGCGDPDCIRGFFLKDQIGPGGSNFSRVQDPTLDQFFQQGLTATTDAAAAAAYAKVQQRINEMAYVIPLYDTVTLYALRDHVKGFNQSSTGRQIWQDFWISN